MTLARPRRQLPKSLQTSWQTATTTWLEPPSNEALLNKLILIGQRIQEQFRLTAGTGQAINSPAAPCRDQELEQLYPEQGLSGQTAFHCTIKVHNHAPLSGKSWSHHSKTYQFFWDILSTFLQKHWGSLNTPHRFECHCQWFSLSLSPHSQLPTSFRNWHLRTWGCMSWHYALFQVVPSPPGFNNKNIFKLHCLQSTSM